MSFTVISSCRRVTKWGLRGVRVGEASNPGPASKRRRTQRLRALQRSTDSDSEDDRPLVPTSGPEVFAMSDREDSNSPQLLVEGDWCCSHSRLEAPRDPCATDLLQKRGQFRFVGNRLSDLQQFHRIVSLHWTAKRQQTPRITRASGRSLTQRVL